jgi:hypothetical protein
MVNGKDSKIANILYIYMFLKNSQNQYKSDWLKCIINYSGYSVVQFYAICLILLVTYDFQF